MVKRPFVVTIKVSGTVEAETAEAASAVVSDLKGVLVNEVAKALVSEVEKGALILGCRVKGT